MAKTKTVKLNIPQDHKGDFCVGDYIKLSETSEDFIAPADHSSAAGTFEACCYYSTKENRYEWCQEWRWAEHKASRPVIACVRLFIKSSSEESQ